MSARRYWINPNKIADETVVIDEQLHHHVCVVCKHEVGDKVELLPGDGEAYLVEIINIKKKAALGKILSKRTLPSLPKPHIHLCVSIPKFNKLEFIIEKSVELGVASVRPFVSEFSYIKSKGKVSDSKLSRWRGIISSASQQCGRGELMSFGPIVTLSELIDEAKSEKVFSFAAYENARNKEDAMSLKAHLSGSLDVDKVGSLDSVMVFVGSEGGFSEKEADLFSTSDILPVSMGEQILRVETACVALISSIKYELST